MLLQSSLFFPGSMVGYPIRFTTLHTIAPVARYRMIHDRCWRLFFSSRIARWRWFLRGCAFVSRLEGKRGGVVGSQIVNRRAGCIVVVRHE